MPSFQNTIASDSTCRDGALSFSESDQYSLQEDEHHRCPRVQSKIFLLASVPPPHSQSKRTIFQIHFQLHHSLLEIERLSY